MAAKVSPVTGIIDESDVVIDFGHHEGRTVSEIVDLDPQFYAQLVQAKEVGDFAIRRTPDKSFRLYCSNLPKLDN